MFKIFILFAGKVTGYISKKGAHKVTYKTGEDETLRLDDEDVYFDDPSIHCDFLFFFFFFSIFVSFLFLFLTPARHSTKSPPSTYKWNFAQWSSFERGTMY